MNVTPSQIDLLSTLLDSAALRHRVLANNVANVNTPNFKRLTVLFDNEVERAIAAGKPLNGATAKIAEDLFAAERVDGNTVDIDREMNEITKNAQLYSAIAQILANRVGLLRTAITG
jgi:flagellar basal-body rod protein FlgB